MRAFGFSSSSLLHFAKHNRRCLPFSPVFPSIRVILLTPLFSIRCISLLFRLLPLSRKGRTFPMCAAKNYPDISHLSEMEDELGFTLDQAFIEEQRAALRRIQSDRSCVDLSNNRHQARGVIPGSPSFGETKGDAGRDRYQEFGFLRPEEIQEQREIYEQCQSRRTNRSKQAKISKSGSDHEEERVTTFNADRHEQIPMYPTSASCRREPGCFGNGRKVRIISEKQVYKDISSGNAILVQCMNCESYLQVGEKTVNVFCTICQSISPINHGVGLKSVSPQIDLALASTLQIQEKDAFVRMQNCLSKETNSGTNSSAHGV